MKSSIEKRTPGGLTDRVSLAVTTFGVGYLPLAPGTWGSAVGVVIYLGLARWYESVQTAASLSGAAMFSSVCIALTLFSLVAFWAADRSIPLLGNTDPPEAVVDEVLGQLITLLFIPIAAPWPFVLAGFLLFRTFDIWKPYPIDKLQGLPGGLGVCADDIFAGAYAGVCLSALYAISLSI